MPTRVDLGRRSRAKSLARLKEDKMQHPEKYEHETSEYSIYLGLKYDLEHKQLNPGKLPYFNELKKKYGV